MTWIDGSRWDVDRGQQLTKILIREYNLLADTRAMLDYLGLDPGLMPDAPTARVRWIELARGLHEAQALRKVADHLASEKPALAGSWPSSPPTHPARWTATRRTRTTSSCSSGVAR